MNMAFANAGLALASFLIVTPLSAQTAPGPKTVKVEEKTPDNLPRTIHHQLVTLPFYSVFDNLSFSISGRKVTLSGQVVRKTLKDHAEASVKSLEGVGLVVNNIEVLPVSAVDDELRRNLYRAIFEDAVLERYAIPALPSIHIIVKNRAVTLEGTIESDTDKHLAGKQASGVPNILGVQNNLVVRLKDAPGN
jgi:hyperosmotically inducible protein